MKTLKSNQLNIDLSKNNNKKKKKKKKNKKLRNKKIDKNNGKK